MGSSKNLIFVAIVFFFSMILASCGRGGGDFVAPRPQTDLHLINAPGHLADCDGWWISSDAVDQCKKRNDEREAGERMRAPSR